MAKHLPKSSRTTRVAGVADRRRAGTSSKVPPGCPSFVADPSFRELATGYTYGRGATIARQGDEVRYAYVLRRGLVEVSSVLPNGKSFLDLMGPGSVLLRPDMFVDVEFLIELPEAVTVPSTPLSTRDCARRFLLPGTTACSSPVQSRRGGASAIVSRSSKDSSRAISAPLQDSSFSTRRAG